MPREYQGKLRGRKKAIAPDREAGLIEFLTNGLVHHDAEFTVSPLSEEEIVEGYQQHGKDIIRRCKRQDSTRRPWCWWRFESKEPRKQIQELPEGFRLSPAPRQSLWFGLPDRFEYGTVLLRTYQAYDDSEPDPITKAMGIPSLCQQFISCFETQQDYLERTSK